MTPRAFKISLCLVGLGLLLVAFQVEGQEFFLRMPNDEMVPYPADPVAVELPPPSDNVFLCPAKTPFAWNGQAVPGGGTLGLAAYSWDAMLNDEPSIAFVSRIDGVERNQAVFVADAGGLQPIAVGCGGGGGSGDPGSGCGDPSPIGGTFSGLFLEHHPAFNDAGDVLFLADVDGGSSYRGLFLYQAASATIVKVAAVGDLSPLGSTLAAVGPGSLNDSGQVVFVARNADTGDVNILSWQMGTLSTVAAVGDPGPSGYPFTFFAGEQSYADGTSIPGYFLPDINDQGQIAFLAVTMGGWPERGLVVSTGGNHQWYVHNGEPTPAGGTFEGFFSPILNNAGQIAFFAEFKPTPTTNSSGWFVGTPGQWRLALVGRGRVGDRRVRGLAVSRNPMQPLNDEGDLLMWARLSPPLILPRSLQKSLLQPEALILSTADGRLVIVAKEGGSTPLGGSFGALQGWPSLNGPARGTLGAATPGASTSNAHMILSRCIAQMREPE